MLKFNLIFQKFQKKNKKFPANLLEMGIQEKIIIADSMETAIKIFRKEWKLKDFCLISCKLIKKRI